MNDSEAGNPEGRGVARDAGRAIGAFFDGNCRIGGIAQHPLDADRAGACANVPQKLAAPRR